jgi:nitrate reductase (NAD(P)H)
MIKVYKQCDEYPVGGAMSQKIAQMRPGDKILMEGPKGLLNYKGYGNFLIRKKPVKKTKIGLIAGGAGITPCY